MTRLVYLSPLPWASFAQRPHKFVDWFHDRCGGDVLWLDPYPTRLPELADIPRATTAGGGSANPAAREEAPEWLTVLCPRALPIEPLPGAGILNRLIWHATLEKIQAFVEKGKCLLAIGKPSELALQVLDRHPTERSLYDAMDDFPAFYRGLSRSAMMRREQAVASRVSRISVSSTVLAERFSNFRSKLKFAPNACAVDVLPPINAMAKRPETPVLGYVGTIGHWFDWGLVFALAEANPAMCIRLCGPVYSEPPSHMPGNIDMLPACDHAAAINIMQKFSVGLIPFKRTDLTASVDPIKYYEYRALGLPVLSTRFGEMALRDGQPGVVLVGEHSDIASKVMAALAFEYKIDEIQEFRKANSWEARFDASGILP